MSRVVIVAVVRSPSWTGSGVPSYAKRRIPSDVPAQARRVAQLRVVVDVAVQGRDHVGPVAVVLLLVDRVGVGLGDDPDARPSGVREHRRLCVVVTKGQTQELVGHDGLTYGTRVVAQLSDLGRRIVGDAQIP